MNTSAIYFLTNWVEAPTVLKKAQIKDSKRITKNYLQGKKNVSYVPKNNVDYKVIVYPIIMPTITPRRQLASTSTLAS